MLSPNETNTISAQKDRPNANPRKILMVGEENSSKNTLFRDLYDPSKEDVLMKEMDFVGVEHARISSNPLEEGATAAQAELWNINIQENTQMLFRIYLKQADHLILCINEDNSDRDIPEGFWKAIIYAKPDCDVTIAASKNTPLVEKLSAFAKEFGKACETINPNINDAVGAIKARAFQANKPLTPLSTDKMCSTYKAEKGNSMTAEHIFGSTLPIFPAPRTPDTARKILQKRAAENKDPNSASLATLKWVGQQSREASRESSPTLVQRGVASRS